MKIKLDTYTQWTAKGLLIALVLLIDGVKLTLLWETVARSGYGPLLLHLFLHLTGEAGVLSTIGGLILAPVLILMIVGSLLVFAAYGCPASASPH